MWPPAFRVIEAGRLAHFCPRSSVRPVVNVAPQAVENLPTTSQSRANWFMNAGKLSLCDGSRMLNHLMDRDVLKALAWISYEIGVQPDSTARELQPPSVSSVAAPKSEAIVLHTERPVEKNGVRLRGWSTANVDCRRRSPGGVASASQ